MNKAMLFIMLLMAPSVYANQALLLEPIRIEFTAENALTKFEETILNPEGMLIRYQPVGAKISAKHVVQNEISFIATKSVLFISKSVHVHGVLESFADKTSCTENEAGYSLKMHFDSSDTLVTNNVEGLEAIICLDSKFGNEIVGHVRSKIIIGNNYSQTLGPIAIKLIKEQVSPLINALIKEIKSLR